MLKGLKKFKRILLLLTIIVMFVVLSLAASVLAADDDVGASQPSVESITAPSEPVPIAQQISFTASFTDPGFSVFVHTAAWDWGDGSQCETSIHTDCTLTEPSGSELGSVSGSHTYNEPGIYNTVQLTVKRVGGSSDVASSPPVVVFDPEGGFVTGGGWIDSPANACPVFCDDAIGKATFGFVSKYKKGASIPTGQTEFQFKAGGLNFHSDSCDWLVVNQGGSNAQFKGSGTINGQGTSNGIYKFQLWAGDADPDDTFRIKIWWEEEDGTENVVYDNGPDQAIGGGGIVVHTGKK